MKVRTILHCHARGVHSLLLHEDPVVRVFVTDEDHVAHTNGLGDGVGAYRFIGQSVGFHRHRYDLKLSLLRGEVWNVFATIMPGVAGLWSPFSRCEYRSAIRDGESRLDFTGEMVRLATDYQQLEVFASHFMRADELHTVAVPKGHVAAWLVQEFPTRTPPTDLSVYTMRSHFDPTGMYREGTDADTERLLLAAGFLDGAEAAAEGIRNMVLA